MLWIKPRDIDDTREISGNEAESPFVLTPHGETWKPETTEALQTADMEKVPGAGQNTGAPAAQRFTERHVATQRVAAASHAGDATD